MSGLIACSLAVFCPARGLGVGMGQDSCAIFQNVFNLHAEGSAALVLQRARAMGSARGVFQCTPMIGINTGPCWADSRIRGVCPGLASSTARGLAWQTLPPPQKYTPHSATGKDEGQVQRKEEWSCGHGERPGEKDPCPSDRRQQRLIVYGTQSAWVSQ